MSILNMFLIQFQIDECQRLWVMDAGKIGDKQVCPPQLLAFDLTTDQLIYRHVVNASNYVESSLYITPVSNFHLYYKPSRFYFVYHRSKIYLFHLSKNCISIMIIVRQIKLI